MDANHKEKESVNVLRECIELQLKKSRDYQNPNSNVTQAMHYRRGVDTIHDIMQGKMYRAQSLLESRSNPSFESLEDTYKDLINYASFAVAWLRKKMEGQDTSRDIFNRKLEPVAMEQLFREVEEDLYAIAKAELKKNIPNYKKLLLDEQQRKDSSYDSSSCEDREIDDASQYC